jgi:putative mRNA 3-end processing factor
MSLITVDEYGLRCEAGGFWIDPWRPVSRAVITHAHGDHARPGSGHYICSEPTAAFLRHRLGPDTSVESPAWGEQLELGDARVSLHPAGHCAGSAQVRVEAEGEVWVAAGDHKRAPDPSSETFELVPCDALIAEATFALPVYTWQPGSATAQEILAWWQDAPDRASLLFCYAFGKTQRVLAELAALPEAQALAEERGVYLHGAAVQLTEIYRQLGYNLLPTAPAQSVEDYSRYRGALIVAPPSAHRSPWMNRFREPQTAFASGWMLVRGARRRRGYERGFVISDHGDWNDLISTVADTGAQHVYVTHGHNEVFARYLSEELGVPAEPLNTLYEGEVEEE